MHLVDYPYVQLFEVSNDIVRDAEYLLVNNNKVVIWRHVDAVAQTSAGIAERYSLDVEICKIAGYLHDISAVIKPVDMLAYMESIGMEIDPAEDRYPFLLHQQISKFIAENHFGIEDERILSAIGHHTTLRWEPSSYDMVVFIADKLSWDQEGKPPYYDAVAEGLNLSLEHSCFAYLDYVLANDMILYPHRWLLESYQYLKEIIEG